MFERENAALDQGRVVGAKAGEYLVELGEKNARVSGLHFFFFLGGNNKFLKKQRFMTLDEKKR